jgi:hypothetical protein
MSHTAVPYTIWIAPLSPLADMQRREKYRTDQWVNAKVRAGPDPHTHACGTPRLHPYLRR